MEDAGQGMRTRAAVQATADNGAARGLLVVQEGLPLQEATPCSRCGAGSGQVPPGLPPDVLCTRGPRRASRLVRAAQFLAHLTVGLRSLHNLPLAWADVGQSRPGGDLSGRPQPENFAAPNWTIYHSRWADNCFFVPASTHFVPCIQPPPPGRNGSLRVCESKRIESTPVAALGGPCACACYCWWGSGC